MTFVRRCILAVLALALTGCAKKFPGSPADVRIPDPLADSVEAVVFLLGDAGNAHFDASPLLMRLRNEVEQWSREIGRANSVAVVYLGDNVYPVGLRDATDRAFPEDSARLQAQLDVMNVPNGKRFNARALFVAGNHDWGHMPGARGRDRLDNMGRFIARRSRAADINAELVPRAGDVAVEAFDVGSSLRVLLIDTAWWLLEANPSEKDYFTANMDRQLAGKGDRNIVIAAHHPWASGASHGGLIPFWKLFGVRWLLNKSGAQLQDINSLPYLDLKNRFMAMFQKYGKPFMWAGGHDHALQVIRGNDPNQPVFNIVSGAGSKVSAVGPINGTEFYRAEPGFMRLVVMKNGAIYLFVVSARRDFLQCNHGKGTPALQQCVDAGINEFRTVFSIRLK
jgi:hypothetical protein